MRDYGDRDKLVTIVRSIAKRVGIKPGRRTQVRSYTGGPKKGLFGYIKVYQGTNPTPAERKLFKRVVTLASAYTPVDCTDDT